MAVAAACGPTGPATESAVETEAGEVLGPLQQDAALRFPGSARTLEKLGEQVLTALTRSDTLSLASFRLTENEHNEVVWPELPASDPEVNFPVDYAWSNIENRNRRGVARLVPIFADRTVGFQGTDCRGPIERFETFVVRTDCWVVFVTNDSPERWEAQLFKDAVERGGGLKVFRYYDEEPRPYRGTVQ